MLAILLSAPPGISCARARALVGHADPGAACVSAQMEVSELRSLHEPLLPTHRGSMSVEVITRSFAFMEYRKMRRSLFGLYPEKGRVTLFWGLAYSAVLCTLVGLEHAGWQPVHGLRLSWDLDDVCFGGLLTLVCCSTLTLTLTLT